LQASAGSLEIPSQEGELVQIPGSVVAVGKKLHSHRGKSEQMKTLALVVAELLYEGVSLNQKHTQDSQIQNVLKI